MLIYFFNIFLALILSLSLGLQLGVVNPKTEILVKPQRIVNKGIYLTAYTAGSAERRQTLIDLIKSTELNTVVIDIKDYSGKIFYNTDVPLAKSIGSVEVRIKDIKKVVADLKQQGIYSIARIVVFQDPYLAERLPDIALKNKSGGIWRDKKGLSWVDPTQRLVWDYNLDLATEAAQLGFDEINFDYIRFPSDGDIDQIAYANLSDVTAEGKVAVIADFYNYLNQRLEFVPVLTSADLFGMVLWRSDGLNIGQRLEDAMANFDYICPMVYPSHYPVNFEGFANPADHPYEIVYRSLIKAKDKLIGQRAVLRPWLQDFNLGAIYTSDMIKLQKQASYDAGSSGWLLWNAGNNYSTGGLEIK